MDRWGDFLIIEEIGRGGFGSVYRAYHPTLRHEVALKLIPVPSNNPRDIEKALEEPRRLVTIRHQNVVIVHDARYHDGHVGICMELIRGESLAQMVDRRGRLGPEEAFAYGRAVCCALAEVHAAQIVHNDVKAQNVMREDGGRIVLMDFGAGRRLLEPESTTGLKIVGTPVYMAPELFQFREPTVRSDIYSLGVLLFYLLTGRYPVDGTSAAEIAAAHHAQRRRYLEDLRSDLPRELTAVVNRALEPDPARRFATPGEMLHAMDVNSPVHVVAPPAPRVWLGVSAIVVALAVPIVWALGFIACQAYAVMFGLKGDFYTDSATDWLYTGMRVMPLPIFIMVVSIVMCIGAGLTWRIAGRLVPAFGRWSARVRSVVAQAGTRAGLTDRGTLAGAVLIAQLLLLAAFYWRFNELIEAFMTPLAEGALAVHARLAPENEGEWLAFRSTASVLTLASGVAWTAMLVSRRRGEGGLVSIVAGLVLAGVFAILFAAPWRIVHEATFQQAMFGSQRCFVIRDTASSVLLYCPGLPPPRTLVVGRNDARLHRLAQVENIFSAAATSSTSTRPR